MVPKFHGSSAGRRPFHDRVPVSSEGPRSRRRRLRWSPSPVQPTGPLRAPLGSSSRQARSLQPGMWCSSISHGKRADQELRLSWAAVIEVRIEPTSAVELSFDDRPTDVHARPDSAALFLDVDRVRRPCRGSRSPRTHRRDGNNTRRHHTNGRHRHRTPIGGGWNRHRQDEK